MSYSQLPAHPSTSSCSRTRRSHGLDPPDGAGTTFGSNFRSSDDDLASDSPFGGSDDSVDGGDIQTLALEQFVRDYDTPIALPQPPPDCRVTALDLLRLRTRGLLMTPSSPPPSRPSIARHRDIPRPQQKCVSKHMQTVDLCHSCRKTASRSRDQPRIPLDWDIY